MRKYQTDFKLKVVKSFFGRGRRSEAAGAAATVVASLQCWQVLW
jgi:hypothetical protein